jgi:hypothetical protein
MLNVKLIIWFTSIITMCFLRDIQQIDARKSYLVKEQIIKNRPRVGNSEGFFITNINPHRETL